MGEDVRTVAPIRKILATPEFYLVGEWGCPHRCPAADFVGRKVLERPAEVSLKPSSFYVPYCSLMRRSRRSLPASL